MELGWTCPSGCPTGDLSRTFSLPPCVLHAFQARVHTLVKKDNEQKDILLPTETKQFFYINIPGILASGEDSTVGRPRIFSIFSNGKTVHIWGFPIFNCVASFYLHFSKLPVTMLCYSSLGLTSLPFSYLKSLINLSLITMPPSKGRIRQDSKTMND